MLNVLLIFIILILVGGIVYYFMFLKDDDTPAVTNPSNEDDPIHEDEEDENDLRDISINLSDDTKTYLEGIYGGDVLNTAIYLNESEGAPSYLTCTGMFNPFKNTCREDKEFGIRWEWYNDNDLLGARCHMLVDKYRIQYYRNNLKRFDVDVDANETSFGVHDLDNNLTGSSKVHIVPVYGNNYAVSATATKSFADVQRIKCENTKNDVNGDIETIDYDDL